MLADYELDELLYRSSRVRGDEAVHVTGNELRTLLKMHDEERVQRIRAEAALAEARKAEQVES